MKRPLALTTSGKPLPAFPWVPSLATDTRVVEGVQPAGTPTQVSRTKTSPAPLVSPATRLLASAAKATNRPSALMAGVSLTPLPSLPSLATDTRAVKGVHAAAAPTQEARSKEARPPGLALETGIG